MSKMTIRDVDVKGKKCLTRVDFNVPMVDGVITDENRINGALPTIQYLMDHGAKVILCSHLGKPHNIFTPGFGLTKKEKKAVEALPESERAAATEEYIAKALKNDPKKFLSEACRGQTGADLPRQGHVRCRSRGRGRAQESRRAQGRRMRSA